MIGDEGVDVKMKYPINPSTGIIEGAVCKNTKGSIKVCAANVTGTHCAFYNFDIDIPDGTEPPAIPVITSDLNITSDVKDINWTKSIEYQITATNDAYIFRYYVPPGLSYTIDELDRSKIQIIYNNSQPTWEIVIEAENGEGKATETLVVNMVSLNEFSLQTTSITSGVETCPEWDSTAFRPMYHDGDNADIDNTTKYIYEDNKKQRPFNGETKYYNYNSAGQTNATGNVVRIGSTGKMLGITECLA